MFYVLVSTVLGLSSIVLLVFYLKTKNILSASAAPFVNNLIMNVILPANIVRELMHVSLRINEIKMALIFIIEVLVLLAFTYSFGRIMKFSRHIIGGFMLSTSFCATALVGLPVIKILFPDNIRMHADAIITSELGMVVPFLILGPIIAQLFGENQKKENLNILIKNSLIRYLKSPVGISLFVGILLSFLNLKTDNAIIDFTDKVLAYMSSGLTLMPLVLMGLILEVKSFKNIIKLVVVALIMQMLLEPLLAKNLSNLFNLETSERNVIMILSMSPSALLTPAFALKYNCAPSVCSAITFICVVSTTFVLPIGYYLLS